MGFYFYLTFFIYYLLRQFVDESIGEYLALTGAKLNGKEMISAGLATHSVPSEVRNI